MYRDGPQDECHRTPTCGTDPTRQGGPRSRRAGSARTRMKPPDYRLGQGATRSLVQ